MQITVNGSPKEIADLVSQLQSQQPVGTNKFNGEEIFSQVTAQKENFIKHRNYPAF